MTEPTIEPNTAPTTEEMREQLVNNEIDYITQMASDLSRYEELFAYVKKTCGFEDDDDSEIESIYMNLYGDMFDE